MYALRVCMPCGYVCPVGMYALWVQIECAGAGEPCLRHYFGSRRNASLLGSFPEGAVERSETEGVAL